MRTFYFITLFSFFIALLHAQEPVYIDISECEDRQYELNEGKYILTGKKTGEFNIIKHGWGELDLTLEDVTIECYTTAAINIANGSAKVTLKGNNHLKSSVAPGLAFPYEAFLTITEESDGAYLNVEGVDGSAIGHNSDNYGGSLNINGGFISAKCTDKSGPGIKSVNLIINGGLIISYGNSGTSGSKATVNGGTILGDSPDFAIDIEKMNGGSVRTVKSPESVKNKDRTFLKQKIVETDYKSTKITELAYNDGESLEFYGQNDLYPDEEGKLYLWLPDNDKEVVVKSVAYQVIFNTREGRLLNPLWLENGIYQIESLDIEKPERPYYSFLGWSDTDSDIPVETITVDGSGLTLNAIWEANPIVTDADKCAFSCMVGEEVDIDLSTIIAESDDSGPKEFRDIEILPPGLSLENGRLKGRVDNSGIYTFKVGIHCLSTTADEKSEEITVEVKDRLCKISGEPKNNYYKEQKIYLEPESNGSISQVAYSLEDTEMYPGNWHDLNQPVEVEGLQEGENTVYYWIKDKATTHIFPERKSISFLVDRESPLITIEGEENRIKVKVKDETSGIASIQYSLDTGQNQSVSVTEGVHEHEFIIPSASGIRTLNMYVEDMAGNVTQISEPVTVTASPNEPYYSISLPSFEDLEGVTFNPSFGRTLYVNEGEDYYFQMIIDPDYSDSKPELLVNGELLKPYQSPLRSNIVYAYHIRNIRQDIKIEVKGIKRNDSSVSNNRITDDKEWKIWTTPGYLHLRTETKMLINVTNIQGTTILNREINGDISLSLPAGIYIIRVKNEKIKVVVN